MYAKVKTTNATSTIQYDLVPVHSCRLLHRMRSHKTNLKDASGDFVHIKYKFHL